MVKRTLTILLAFLPKVPNGAFSKAGDIMRTLLGGLTVIFCICLADSAQAERRMFIIADGDGYGIDRCLASGDKCGAAAANAYCKTHQFASAAFYRKVDRDDITGAIPTGGSGGCGNSHCDIIAIVCSR